MWKAREWLAGGSRDKKVLIVISDGGDNASAHTLADVLQAGNKSNIQVYTIGIFDPDDPDKNPAVLRQLAMATGGEAFVPNELSEVVSVCESIARDIRTQYTLGYLSNAATQGGVITPSKYWPGEQERPNCMCEPGRDTPVADGEAAGQGCRCQRNSEVESATAVGGAFLALAYCGFVMLDSWTFQRSELREFNRILSVGPPVVLRDSGPPVADALIGRIEVRRLGLSAMVVEGTTTLALRRAAGHYEYRNARSSGQRRHCRSPRHVLSAPAEYTQE